MVLYINRCRGPLYNFVQIANRRITPLPSQLPHRQLTHNVADNTRNESACEGEGELPPPTQKDQKEVLRSTAQMISNRYQSLSSDDQWRPLSATPSSGDYPQSWTQLRRPQDLWDKWMSRITAENELEHIPPDVMFQLLETARLENTVLVYRTVSETYSAMVHELCLRKEYSLAREWWHKLRQTGVMTHEGMAWGLRCLAMNGNLHEAFDLLESLHAYNTLYKQDDTPSPELVFLCNQGIEEYLCVLFHALGYHGRPDLIFGLWDHMEILYDISPNEILLTYLLNAASVAIEIDDSLKSVEQPAYIPLPKNTSFREQAREGILRMIDEPMPSKIRWRDSHPGLVARQIWRQAMISSNPPLVDVWSPVLITGPYDGAVSAAAFERVATFRHRRLPHPKSYTTMLIAFQAYIIFLGSMSLVAEVPLILAWMHASKILPTPILLKIAHELWDTFGLRESRDSTVPSKKLREWTLKCWHSRPPPTQGYIKNFSGSGKYQAASR